MKHIPTIAFLVAYAYIFTTVMNKLTGGGNSMIQWAVYFIVAATLALIAASLVFAAARRGVVIYRWLRLKIRQCC